MNITDSKPIDITAGDELTFQLLPARGLDVGETRMGGELVSWVAPDGVITEPVFPDGEDDPFIASFGGGLMLTCGLHNVGYTSGGQPWNGRYSLTAAKNITVTQTTEYQLITGEVLDDGLLCRREIRVLRDSNALTVSDTVTNVSDEELFAPIMYHINIGGALVGQRTVVTASVLSTEVVHGTEAADGSSLVEASGDHPFAVLDDRIGLLTQKLSSPEVNIFNPDSGLAITIGWTGLDRLHYFVDHPRMLLGIEPSNSGVYGRETERQAAGAAILAPGQVRTSSFTVLVERR